jgi:hypothetical protein
MFASNRTDETKPPECWLRKPRQVGADHGSEQTDLDVADDGVAQPVDQGRLANRRQGPQHGDGQNSGRDPDDRPVGRKASSGRTG